MSNETCRVFCLRRFSLRMQSSIISVHGGRSGLLLFLYKSHFQYSFVGTLPFAKDLLQACCAIHKVATSSCMRGSRQGQLPFLPFEHLGMAAEALSLRNARAALADCFLSLYSCAYNIVEPGSRSRGWRVEGRLRGPTLVAGDPLI